MSEPSYKSRGFMLYSVLPAGTLLSGSIVNRVPRDFLSFDNIVAHCRAASAT